MNRSLKMHNDALQLFGELQFKDVLTLDNVVSKKKAIKLNKQKYYGYFLEKGNETYFLEDVSDEESSVLNELPIKITSKTETDYNKTVFWFIGDYLSVKIPTDKKLSFRELIHTLSDFKHTNSNHFLLYKIICAVAYFARINFRVITDRGFGKDSAINNIRDLVSSVANIYGATFAKLEYSLTNKVLIFNEMGNLKADDKHNMQQFLLAVGAFFNKYTKKSRATEDTLEVYDISKTSLGILYNSPSYYTERNQEFFDTMFTKAVAGRFIPFYFTGKLDEKFDSSFDVEEVVNENMNLYRDIISTILYFKGRPISNKYEIPDEIEFNEDERRFERTFLKIADYISEYAETKEEYYELLFELYGTYKKYDDVLAEAMVGVVN